jgi:hypothetical protein
MVAAGADRLYWRAARAPLPTNLTDLRHKESITMTTASRLVAAVLAGCLALPSVASADGELGRPIVELMPQVKKLRAELGLNAEQQAALDAWIAEAPKKRKQLEAETLQIKQQLRDAILDGSDRLTREALKQALAEKQTRLIEMRSLCTRMLRQTLDEEQFARVVASYRAG